MVDPSPLDDVEFLARSPHRVAVFRLLQEGPWTRPDLHATTDISQPTLGRVLGSLEDRNWVTLDGGVYSLTAVGALVTEAFADLLDTIETVHRLGDVIDLLPIDKLDLDVRALAGATVAAPERGDPLDHISHVEDLIIEAERVRFLTPVMWPDAVQKLLERHEGDSSYHHEAIFSREAVDAGLAKPGLVASARFLLDTHDVDLFRYDGTVELLLAVADGTAVIGPLDDQHLPRAFIESDDESVLSSVEAKLDAFREASTRLTMDDLPS